MAASVLAELKAWDRISSGEGSGGFSGSRFLGLATLVCFFSGLIFLGSGLAGGFLALGGSGSDSTFLGGAGFGFAGASTGLASGFSGSGCVASGSDSGSGAGSAGLGDGFSDGPEPGATETSRTLYTGAFKSMRGPGRAPRNKTTESTRAWRLREKMMARMRMAA